MKVLKYALYITASVIFLAIIGYSYYGGFQSIKPQLKTVGGEVLVYEKIKGDYSQSAAVSQRVNDRLKKEFEIITTKGFGIYYDIPGTVESYNLKSDVGCILEAADTNKIKNIQLEFYVNNYPVEEYLVVEFPFKGNASIMMGLIKVYPAIEKFSNKNGYDPKTPVMEIWDTKNGVIIYRKKLLRPAATL